MAAQDWVCEQRVRQSLKLVLCSWNRSLPLITKPHEMSNLVEPSVVEAPRALHPESLGMVPKIPNAESNLLELRDPAVPVPVLSRQSLPSKGTESQRGWKEAQ